VNRAAAEAAINRRRGWTDPERLASFATAALLLDDAPPLRRAGLQAIGRGTLKLDARLVEDFYRISGRAEKLAIVECVSATPFPAAPFKRLFVDATATTKPNARERGRLGLALRFHVGAQPNSAERFRSVIKRLLRSRVGDERLHALELVSRLDRVGLDDRATVASLLRSRKEGERMNAINALAEWTRRPGVSATVKRFAASARVAVSVRRLHKADPSPDVRLCAKYYLKEVHRSRAGGASR
jgi:hypothetical protein